MRAKAWHGTVSADIVRFDTRPRGNHVSKVGAWFSEEPLVAEFFARLKGEERGPEMWVYEVELEFRRPRVYPDYLSLQMDFALNPLVDDTAFFSHADFMRWAAAHPDWDDRAPSSEHTRRFRHHLLELGYDGIVVDACRTDGGLLRSDYVALYPECVTILSLASVEPFADGPCATPDELMARIRQMAEARGPTPR